MSQKFFWKNLSKFRNNCLKFEQTVVKIRPQYEHISKIPSRGWRSWKNWFFTLTTFLLPAIFLIHEILKKDQKMTGAKKVVKVKNQLFYACSPCEGIFEIYSYRGLIFELFSQNFEPLFPNVDRFLKKKFWLKSLQRASTLTG